MGGVQEHDIIPAFHRKKFSRSQLPLRKHFWFQESKYIATRRGERRLTPDSPQTLLHSITNVWTPLICQ